MKTNGSDDTTDGAAAPTVADAVDAVAAARRAERAERRAVVTKWLALLDLADQRATMALDGVDRDTWLQVDLGLLRSEAQQVGRLSQVRRTMPLVWSRFIDHTISIAMLRQIASVCSSIPVDRVAVADLAVAARIDITDRECASAVIDDVELIAHELGPDNDEDHDARADNKLTIDQARGTAFIGLITRSTSDGDNVAPQLNLTVTTTLDALAGISDEPAMLLANVTGGRLMASAKTIRRWTETHDATVHLVVLDEKGEQVLGAGAPTRFSQGWLDEIVRARHPVSTFPGSRVPQQVSDVDHATDFTPGTTHVDNLAPVDRSRHGQKSRGCWTVTQLPNGSRVWKHTRTEWTAESAPVGAKTDLDDHRAERRKRRRR